MYIIVIASIILLVAIPMFCYQRVNNDLVYCDVIKKYPGNRPLLS